MSFHVGQKVKAIGWVEGAVKGRADCPGAVKGSVYTIRDIDNRLVARHGVLALRFEEIHQKVITLPASLGCGELEWEVAHDSRCFVPVIQRSTETGMAILRKVADDASKKRNLVTTR